MKKIILLLCFPLFSNVIFAQQWLGGKNHNENIYRDGKIGLGTSNPWVKLHIVTKQEYDGIILETAKRTGIEFWEKPSWHPTRWKMGYILSEDQGNWTGKLSFYTHGSGGLENREKLYPTMTMFGGKVGIGTNNPQSTLHVYGTGPSTIFRIQSNPNNGFGKSNLEFWSYQINDQFEWRPGYISSEDAGDWTGRLSFYTNGSGEKNKKTSVHVMSLVNKKVGIGTLNPDEALTVNGNIHAKEVRVDLDVPADYVFQKYFTGNSNLKPDYKLLSISEVEEFIKKNHHLPQIPSAKEIQEKGLNLGEMNNLLLQKIEELTLYSIEQEKLILSLSKRLDNLEKQN